MRNPMPVTTHSMMAVRLSMKHPAVALKLPASIQVYQSTTTESGLPSCHRPIMPNSSDSEIKALAPTPSQIGQWEFPRRIFAPRNPAIMAPNSGSSGIRYEYLTAKRSIHSPFQIAPRIGIQRVFCPKQQHNQAQCQRRLG